MTDALAQELLGAGFEGVDLHVESLSGEWGHDVVEHTAYLRDGSDLEPTGWRAKRGSMVLAFFNDIEPGLFPGRYQQFVAAVKRAPVGDLTHPLEGFMRAAIHTGRPVVDPGARNGIRCTVDWLEHNASAANPLGFSSAVAADPPSAAIAQAAVADAAMAAADPSGGYVPTTPVVAAQITRLEVARRTVAEIDAALRTIDEVCARNLRAPAFAGVPGHDVAVALAALRATNHRLWSRYLPERHRIRRYVVPVPMSTWEVALVVYGDARLASAILAANSLSDPLFVAPGTVIQVLPLD